MKKLKIVVCIFLIGILFSSLLYLLKTNNNIVLAESGGSTSDVQLIARAINR